MTDDLHSFRIGLNDDKCHKCNLTFNEATFVPCKAGEKFEDLMYELHKQMEAINDSLAHK